MRDCEILAGAGELRKGAGMVAIKGRQVGSEASALSRVVGAETEVPMGSRAILRKVALGPVAKTEPT